VMSFLSSGVSAASSWHGTSPVNSRARLLKRFSSSLVSTLSLLFCRFLPRTTTPLCSRRSSGSTSRLLACG
jgi:hypothetical protein